MNPPHVKKLIKSTGSEPTEGSELMAKQASDKDKKEDKDKKKDNEKEKPQGIFLNVDEINNALKLKGENNLLEDQNKITSLADIRFLLQEKPLGVGHAIKLTKRIIGDNPFAVILPDDLIFAKPNALGQLKMIYDKHGGNVIGLNKVKNNEIEKKGIVGYTEDKDRFKINHLVEKPKISDAPSNIGILGRYIFEYSIFDEIPDESDKEINVTDAMMSSINTTPVSVSYTHLTLPTKA